MDLNWFLNNREIIKNLSVNIGTSEAPTYTPICTTSEIGITTDFEEKDFYVFCDAIKRSIITGAKLSLDCNVKIDINNTGIQNILGNVHALIENGEIAQFNNQSIQFELLEKVEGDVLTYKKYQLPVVMKFSDLGGPAEDEGEFSLEMVANGKGTLVVGP